MYYIINIQIINIVLKKLNTISLNFIIKILKNKNKKVRVMGGVDDFHFSTIYGNRLKKNEDDEIVAV